jgi:plasmid stabilization system protein ParE
MGNISGDADVEFVAVFMWQEYTRRVQINAEKWDDLDEQTATIYLGHASAAIEAIKTLRSQKRRAGKPPGKPPNPVTIRGVEYPSAKEAAKALGVAVGTVKSARQNNRLDSVGMGRGHQGREELENRAEKNWAQIHFKGSVFDGWKQAIHITGMSRNALLRRGAKTSHEETKSRMTA